MGKLVKNFLQDVLLMSHNVVSQSQKYHFQHNLTAFLQEIQCFSSIFQMECNPGHIWRLWKRHASPAAQLLSYILTLLPPWQKSMLAKCDWMLICWRRKGWDKATFIAYVQFQDGGQRDLPESRSKSTLVFLQLRFQFRLTANFQLVHGRRHFIIEYEC